MKKIGLGLLFFVFCANLSAQQNTFPSVGNVGIGTTSPTEKLTVNGALKVEQGSNLRGEVKMPDLPLATDGAGQGNNQSANQYKFLVIGTDGVIKRSTTTPSGPGDTDDNPCTNPVTRSKWGNGLDKLFVECPQVNVGISTRNPRVKLDVIGAGYLQKVSLGNISSFTSSSLLNIKSYPTTASTDKIVTISNTANDLFSLNNAGQLDFNGNFNMNFTGQQGPGFEIFKITSQFGDALTLSNARDFYFTGQIFIDGITSSTSSNPLFELSTDNQKRFNVNSNGSFGFNTGNLDYIQYNLYSNKSVAFNLKHDMQGDYDMSMYIEVNRELARPIHIKNSLTNKDLFTVWGNGVVNARKIYAEEVEVRTDAMGISWPDYVFENNYELKKLSEVEKYIKENKHLEGVPSQAEIEKSGVNIGEMNAILLKKIEELTLYVIELEKKIK
jgi:hypothetical protein